MQTAARKRAEALFTEFTQVVDDGTQIDRADRTDGGSARTPRERPEDTASALWQTTGSDELASRQTPPRRKNGKYRRSFVIRNRIRQATGADPLDVRLLISGAIASACDTGCYAKPDMFLRLDAAII